MENYPRRSLSTNSVLPNEPPLSIHIPCNPSVIPGNSLPSAPASPPTPAPSPTPERAPDWSAAAPGEDIGAIDLNDCGNGSGYNFGYRRMRAMFSDMNHGERQRMLAELLNMCDGKLLAYVNNFVAPRLKRDPFWVLPNELCLRILTFVEDARTLARSSQVSKRWRELVSDDMAWKSLCEKHAYRRLSTDAPRPSPLRPGPSSHASPDPRHHHIYGYSLYNTPGLSMSAPDIVRRPSTALPQPTSKRKPSSISYRSHFKQRYQVETAWRTGGTVDTRQITPDQGVATSLHLTPDYIIVALDNAKIQVFDTSGRHLRCLQGHAMGVWAMVPDGDTLVSGGCDRDVRVWNLATGQVAHILRGHTSTVRCLKMKSDSNIAISGSRDTTLRVWDIKTGMCRHVLIGHQASVRCLEIHGDLVVSGSYDTTARIWSISEGRCLRVLQGHFSQIYAVAFDGQRIATGSLDTSVRVWDPRDGRCLAQLQGHTSLVGQLQLRGDTLVTGGSDGSVRVWSLQTFTAIHRLAAHDNSVTSLQFDDGRIVSGGSDGRVKVWDLIRGTLVRELGQPADAVWRVVFEEERAVVLASRGGRTVMEVWSFAPPPDRFDGYLKGENKNQDQIMIDVYGV
ncbi:WD40 repeat-like protein [Piedraia hortae CBS 480.64]|uniref:WD40 repeat-like protein n=1 Tax=Piedraia hortae CBS 480.64 TaxID=1314780 RepID=A0A6A7C4C5_9PEZI|nr:WD40 repeat-like protein [Piedraia hortae CBS 480.64]